MKREQIVKHWDTIKGFKEGKTIQIFHTIHKKWYDVDNPAFDTCYQYRVKPEYTKRLPTIEEVKEWFLENKVFMIKTQPQLYRIECISIDDEIVRIGEVHITIRRLCEDFTHYDGSELYITE